MLSFMEAVFRNPKSFRVIVVALVLAGCEGVPESDDGFETVNSRFYDENNRYAQINEESSDRFTNLDIEGAVAGLDEDFVMYAITEAGAEERVRGKDAVRTALGSTFGKGNWLGADVYRWGLTDNTLVQIEADNYTTEDGGIEVIKTLVVIEYRDGKRWREWHFKPNDM